MTSRFVDLVRAAAFLFSGLCLLAVPPVTDAQQGQSVRKIAVFGSSVARGAGDHQNRGGYAGRLAELLGPRGWEVVNVSRGGDNTVKIAPRFDAELLPQKAGYVLIGLSLSNEGIAKQPDKAYRDVIYEQWRAGVLGLIARCRAAGMHAVIGNCYARNTFASDPALQEYTRRMNVDINRWDAPSVNFLGAIDDGAGAWVKGFSADDGHPNGSGHREMFLAIVPSLFDALEAGKPAPAKAKGDHFARVVAREGAGASLSFAPADPVHSFATSFWIRASKDGFLATVMGKAAVIRTEQVGSGESVSHADFVEPGQKTALVTIGYRDGRIEYSGIGGTAVSAAVADRDGWHHVVLSHACARGVSEFYVDGVLARTVAERLVPDTFLLGGGSVPGQTAETDIKEWSVFRSSLNAYEVQFLYEGGLLQSSLEVYAPLADSSFALGTAVENLAQSLSQVKVVGDLRPDAP